MDLFVNELSLHGQFSSLAPFVAALKEVISCRSVAERYRHPFYCLRAIAERVMVLLGILNRLKGCFGRDTALTAEGRQLIQDFFHGDRALFSDESDTNKRIFMKQLTFLIPTGEEIFCPHHGKISFRYYRIHHSWPVVPDQPLYIAYIGPKITKS